MAKSSNAFRADGHNVQFIAELDAGIDDEEVLVKTRESNPVLLTADEDFGELVFRQALAHFGVVLIRLAGIAADEKARLVSQAFAQHSPDLYGAFSVLSPKALRIRNLT